MKKLICIALIFVAVKSSAQRELATPEQIRLYFENVRRADSALAKDVSGKLVQYYNRSDFFMFRGKDMIKDSTEVKDYLVRSYDRYVGGISMSYVYLGIYFQRKTSPAEMLRRLKGCGCPTIPSLKKHN